MEVTCHLAPGDFLAPAKVCWKGVRLTDFRKLTPFLFVCMTCIERGSTWDRRTSTRPRLIL